MIFYKNMVDLAGSEKYDVHEEENPHLVKSV